jgi:molecular chaperone DnaK
MIFQTENQLKEFGEKLSDDKKAPIETALADLKKAYEAKEPSSNRYRFRSHQ